MGGSRYTRAISPMLQSTDAGDNKAVTHGASTGKQSSNCELSVYEQILYSQQQKADVEPSTDKEIVPEHFSGRIRDTHRCIVSDAHPSRSIISGSDPLTHDSVNMLETGSRSQALKKNRRFEGDKISLFDRISRGITRLLAVQSAMQNPTISHVNNGINRLNSNTDILRNNTVVSMVSNTMSQNISHRNSFHVAAENNSMFLDKNKIKAHDLAFNYYVSKLKNKTTTVQNSGNNKHSNTISKNRSAFLNKNKTSSTASHKNVNTIADNGTLQDSNNNPSIRTKREIDNLGNELSENHFKHALRRYTKEIIKKEINIINNCRVHNEKENEIKIEISKLKNDISYISEKYKRIRHLDEKYNTEVQLYAEFIYSDQQEFITSYFIKLKTYEGNDVYANARVKEHSLDYEIYDPKNNISYPVKISKIGYFILSLNDTTEIRNRRGVNQPVIIEAKVQKKNNVKFKLTASGGIIKEEIRPFPPIKKLDGNYKKNTGLQNSNINENAQYGESSHRVDPAVNNLASHVGDVVDGAAVGTNSVPGIGSVGGAAAGVIGGGVVAGVVGGGVVAGVIGGGEVAVSAPVRTPTQETTVPGSIATTTPKPIVTMALTDFSSLASVTNSTIRYQGDDLVVSGFNGNGVDKIDYKLIGDAGISDLEKYIDYIHKNISIIATKNEAKIIIVNIINELFRDPDLINLINKELIEKNKKHLSTMVLASISQLNHRDLNCFKTEKADCSKIVLPKIIFKRDSLFIDLNNLNNVPFFEHEGRLVAKPEEKIYQVYFDFIDKKWFQLNYAGADIYSENDIEIIKHFALGRYDYDEIKLENPLRNIYFVKGVKVNNKPFPKDQRYRVTAINIYGHIVPITWDEKTKNHGIRNINDAAMYDVRLIFSDNEKLFPKKSLWVINHNDSIKVDRKIINKIARKKIMPSAVNNSMLLPPDNSGIQSTLDGKKYAKIDNKFYAVDTIDQNIIVIKDDNHRVVIDTKENQYHADWMADISGLDNYKVEAKNLRYGKVLNRYFIYDVSDKNKVIEIVYAGNKVYIKNLPYICGSTRNKRSLLDCTKPINLEGKKMSKELKKVLLSNRKIKEYYNQPKRESCETVVRIVREHLKPDKNLTLETRAVGMWRSLNNEDYTNNFVVKVTTNTSEIFIVDINNKIIAAEKRWLESIKRLNKNNFIQYNDFNSSDEATAVFSSFLTCPLLGVYMLNEPDWLIKKLKDYKRYELFKFYNGKLTLPLDYFKKDLCMMSYHGLDVVKNINLNSNWDLNKINVQADRYIDTMRFGSKISVKFTLSYKENSDTFIDIPMLKWNEKIKYNNNSNSNNNNWEFSANMFYLNPGSKTFYTWRNRYVLAYDYVMNKKNVFNQVKLLSKKGLPINKSMFTKTLDAEEKVSQVINYLTNNSGKLEVTIIDLPQLKADFPSERVVDFSIGFENNHGIVQFTQGIITNENGAKVAFVTTSKNVDVASKPKSIDNTPEEVKKDKRTGFFLMKGERAKK